MLGMLRNKRVIFAGDSIARNQWESLLCLLSTAVSDKSSIYEVNRNPITKHSGFLIFKFEDFNCTVEYYRSPFLVLMGHPPVGAPRKVKYALRVDQIDRSSGQWRHADLLILNSGRWWTYEKTLRMGCGFQEGKKMMMNMSVDAAYQRSIETVFDWVNTKVNKKKSQVYFRTFSPSHFSGGNWKNGGGCHLEKLPDLGPLDGAISSRLKIVSDVLSQQPSSLKLLNVTNMTTRRKDGHPSLYNTQPEKRSVSHIQDCSHWCLPGVPDSWNELLYSIFLKRELIRA
ncbi:Trichome birefringence-like family [Parasponia andersonii]|uniref:Trichome birefringence-like family n=1 Tax=Parasponia andersonii TaxID=3476 RepID=A0A2P5CXN0_PARAD|nr:Trichome birefringence-like family [Parasponia andersonii]